MSEPYIFIGKTLPERAEVHNHKSNLLFLHPGTGLSATAEVTIYRSQVSVLVHTDADWSVYDLKNAILNIVRAELTAVGYLKGIGWDVEIMRVINVAKGIDEVFGVDIPCLSGPRASVDAAKELTRLRPLMRDEQGIFIRRCFDDLTSAMRSADDTALFCFRGIEALRLHCATLHGIISKDKKAQWKKFEEVCGFEQGDIDYDSLREASTRVRHGEPPIHDEMQRVEMFNVTWTIVDRYISKLLEKQ